MTQSSRRYSDSTPTWKIPVRSVREHAIFTLAATASASSMPSVPLVELAKAGASRSVTPPIMMLTTAKVPGVGEEEVLVVLVVVKVGVLVMLLLVVVMLAVGLMLLVV